MKEPTINLLVIRTAQPSILAEFYKLLGLNFTYHQHGKGPFHYSAEMNHFVFEIYPLTKNQATANNAIRLGFFVKNLDNLIGKLKKENIQIIKPPTRTEWGYQAIIQDLDGRKIELTAMK